MHVQHAFVRAADRYVLRPWRGPRRADARRRAGFEAEGLGEAYGWDEVVDGEVEVVTVPGNHDTLVLEPNATRLVQELRATLDRTQALRATG